MPEMSPNPAPQPMSASPGGVAVAVADAPDVVERSRGYWERVGKAFFSRALHRIAVGWIFTLLLIIVFVPFIANGAPYTIVIDGERQFPLFRQLTRIDYSVFIAAAAAIVYFTFSRRYAGIEDPERRNAARGRAFLNVIMTAFLLISAVFLFKEDRFEPNDYRGYQAMLTSGRASSAVFAPIPWGYADQEPIAANRVFETPSRDHLLGTDGSGGGQDALARLLWSTRVVLAIGLISQVIALTIGLIYGAIMGYHAGRADILGMRFVEMVESIPTFFLIITFIAIFGRNIFLIMVIIGLTSWTGIARFVRAEFLRLRKLDYVQAAIATGVPVRSLLFRHMLPNGLTPVIVTVTFGIAGAVGSEAGLSFLGIGVEPPTPSWGAMLFEAGNPAETFRWWLAIAPGLLIFMTVFAYNIIGEGLRDATDPRLSKLE